MKFQSQIHKPRVLGVYAHPDDESFCVGGTLAKYAADGSETMIVSFTKGEAGQIHDNQAATRRTLGSTRVDELKKACQRLNVRHVRCLDYEDGRLSEVPFDQLVTDVAQIIREFQPDIVLTFGEDGAYGHPDHVAIGAATDKAFYLAGQPEFAPDQLAAGLHLHTPTHLYHSYFPRNNALLLHNLAGWLQNMKDRFHGCTDYVRGLRVFSKSISMLGFANDHVETEWFAPGFHIVEQGEMAKSLYLILSGTADVIVEDEMGRQTKVGELHAGQFFGETGLVTDRPRSAHVIARGGLSCLVFSPQKPTNFTGRGSGSCVSFTSEGQPMPASQQAICIDTSDYVMDKVAAIAAHRTQCPISPDMFPRSIWNTLLGKEYFVPQSTHLAATS